MMVEMLKRLLEFQLYINDNGVVSCYEGCDDFTFEQIGRRTNTFELLKEIARHMIDVHPREHDELPNG